MASSFRRRAAKPPRGSESPSSSSSPSDSSSSLPHPSISSSSSSFLGLRGTKPWTSGTTLTSTGLPDLDAILGGGQPLGTAVCVSMDDRTQSALASCLIRCWCAEGHHLLVPVLGDDEERRNSPSYPSPWIEGNERKPQDRSYSCSRSSILQLLRSLPRNRHFPRKLDNKKGPTNPHSASLDVLETLEEGRVGAGDSDDEEEDEGSRIAAAAEANLKIAWQYSTTHQHKIGGIVSPGTRRKRGGSSPAGTSSGHGGDVFCHSYDLSAHWTDRASDPSGGTVEEPRMMAALEPIRGLCATEGQSIDAGYTCFLHLCQLVGARLSDACPRSVVRLLLYLGDENDDATSALSVALPLFLSHVRAEVLPVVTLVAVPSSFAAGRSQSTRSMRILQRACDAVLEVENFASRRAYPPPAEFRHLQGLLKVHKVSTHTSSTAVGASGGGGGGGPGHFADWTVTKRPAAFLYGLKRNRRTLSIPMLHIPPEDYAEGGSSVGSGGVRSGAGKKLGCSSSGGAGGTDSPLDF